MAQLSHADVERILLDFSRVVETADFKAWQAQFVDQYVGSFEFGVEENRLEHSDIHNHYMRSMEGQLASALPPGIEMQQVEEAFKEPNLLQALSEHAGRVVETMAQASDFMAFKDMMLFEKEKRQGKLEGRVCDAGVLVHESGTGLFNIAEALEQSAQLSQAAVEDGWTRVLENDWIRIDKKPVHEDRPSEIFLRGVWTMNLSFLECCDIMMSFTDRRTAWDDHFRGCQLIKGGSIAADDIVVTTHIDFGFLLHLAGMPRTLTSRVVRRWGHPEAQSVCFVMIPWKAETDSFDPDNPVLTQKFTVIKPHPTDEARCIMTTIESNKLGRLPTWALGTLINVTAPKIMRKMELRYIASVRAAGTAADVLPADFPGPRVYPKPSPPAPTSSWW